MSGSRLIVTGLLLAALILPAAGSAGGQGPAEDPAGEGALRIFVSIEPQAYLVERIGSDRVTVEVIVKPGQDPHLFETTPQQMARLAEAAAFFRIGVEFENSLIPRIQSTVEGLQIIDCREGIRLRRMDSHGHAHAEDHEDDHDSEGTDPHIWLSARHAIRMAETIRRTLIRLDPQGRETYDAGYRELVEDLQALDRRIEEMLAAVAGKRFFVFHPSFGYFADDYGLEQVAVETGGSEPSARQLADLIEEAREEGVRVIFVQPQFSGKSAETVASEIGGTVVPIDPLARNYMENLERIAQAIEEGLQ